MRFNEVPDTYPQLLATWSEGREGRNSAGHDGESGRAGSGARSSRNVPEIMIPKSKEVLKCLCQMCNKAVLFTPKSDHFFGRNTYLDAKELGGSPSRVSKPTSSAILIPFR